MTKTSGPRKPIDLVIASAGTGKTTRLVSEINDAIDAGAATGSILATTFTNKAAAELVERARSKLIEDGKAGAAAALLTARVGTVNATFGKIVGEFALHAGRSPVADVISEDRRERMFAISAEVAIARRAGDMIPIAGRLEKENWEDDVRKIADLTRQNGIEGGSLEEQARRSWQSLRRIFPKPDEQPGSALDARLHAALTRAQADLDASDDTTGKTANARRVVKEAKAILDTRRHLSWAGWARLTKLDPAVRSRSLVKPVIEIAMHHAAHPGLHTDLEAYILGVYRTAAEALQIYADYKAGNGLVDFIDQEHEALLLLDKPEVAEHLEETLSRVFVDEFQDTSPIQLALFLKVSQIADRSFWVGDPKQAIYGFRGTDPELIEKAAAVVVPRSGGTQGTLTTSYRSRPGLVEFTNLLFTPVFEALDFNPESVRIDKCARSDADTEVPPIAVWGLSGNNWDAAIAALAEHIRQVLSEPEAFAVEERASRGSRPIRGSDIAVLCRPNDRCEAVAAALGEAGVHASIARPGLLETPEAALAVAALRYLVDPGDSLAVAEIAHLFEDGRGQPSWFERSLSDAGIFSLTRELPVLMALDKARKGLAELTPRETLEAAMTASGVVDRIQAWGNALDRIANLDALRGVATQYEDEAQTLRSAATAAGLVTWLAQSASSETELPPSTDPDAVNVLTYHRAKGLEWPMVVLLDLQSARKPSAFGFTVEAGADFDVWEPLQGRWVRFWPWPYGPQAKDVHIDASVLETEEHRAAARREHAEAVRLLYVGMTRARDYLVLAPRERGGRLQLQWLDLLVDGSGNAVLDASRLETRDVLAAGDEDVPARFTKVSAKETPPPARALKPVYRLPEAPVKPEPPPYRIAPSDADAPVAVDASVVSRVELGTRIPFSGSPDMTLLGEAVHAFLAADRPGHDQEARRERAEETLARWAVNGLDAESLVLMSDRLYAHLNDAFPDMRIRSEVPVFARRHGQRLNGRIDLLLTGDAKAVVIDHKSYPGAFDTWEQRALRHAAQLALYASVTRDATACSEVQTWVHMPIVGQLIQVRAEI